METPVLMPKLGMTMEEGTVVQWLKNDGENVVEGEPIVTISSEKTEYEVEAPDSGILEIIIKEDNTVSVSELLGRIKTENNNEQAQGKLPKQVMSPKRIFASPSARKLAKQKGLELATIQGTGPNNRITKKDVLQAISKDEKFHHQPDQNQSDGKMEEESINKGVNEIPISKVRKIIADKMHRSLQESAQLTLHVEVDATELYKLYDQIKGEVMKHFGVDLSLNDLIAKATILTLKKHPYLNSVWGKNKIIQFEYIHLGIALETEKGLLVPVVRNAQSKNLIQLAKDIKSLVLKSKNEHLDFDDISGSTFTITNLGMFGVDEFTPIINPPEVGILGVGRLKEKPSVYKGQIEIRKIMNLSLTFDHRVIDGAPAAKFLQDLCSMIENPYQLLMEEGY